MRKIDELADEQSCLGKAHDDEMLFVLLARDIAAPDTIRFWCAKRVALGLNKDGDPQIAEALQCADQMEIDKAGDDLVILVQQPDLKKVRTRAKQIGEAFRGSPVLDEDCEYIPAWPQWQKQAYAELVLEQAAKAGLK